MSDEESSKSPWDLPWDSKSTSKPSTAVPTTLAPPPPTSQSAVPTLPPVRHQASPFASAYITDKPVSKFTPRPSYTGPSAIQGLSSSSTSSNNNNHNSSSPKMSGLNTSTSNSNRPTLPLPAKASIKFPAISSSGSSSSTNNHNNSRASLTSTSPILGSTIPGLNNISGSASNSPFGVNTALLGGSLRPFTSTPSMEAALTVEQEKKEIARKGM